jgi:hypothetical protein
VAGNQWVTLYVLKDTYDLVLQQNAEIKNVTGTNCNGDNTSVDELSVLNVNAPAGTKVKVYVPNTTDVVVTSGTVAGNQWVTLYVVKATYDIFLEQNTGTKTLEDQNINDDTSIDQLCELKVNAPAGTVVEVLEKGVVTSGTVAGNQWVILYVVKDTYTLRLTQNAEVKDVTGVDCSVEIKTEDHLSVLKVNAPAGAKVKVYVRDTKNEVTSGTVAGNQWVILYVVSDTYDVYLEQGAGQKTLVDQPITSDTDLYELCTLTVKAAAGTSIKVYVSGSANLVTSGTVAGNGYVTLYVVRDTYDVFDGLTTRSVVCSGATASVTFP